MIVERGIFVDFGDVIGEQCGFGAVAAGVERRQLVASVVGVHDDALPDLLQVAGAGDGTRFFARLIQRRKQHSCQDGDDGDNDEEF